MTPFLDRFRRGDVTRDVRLLAARGALTSRPLEQIDLLMQLVGDADAEVAAAADATIARLPRERLAAFLAAPDATPEMRRFFSARGVEPAPSGSADPDAPILDDSLGAGVPEDGAPSDDRRSAVQRIAGLGVPERVALAMKGTREERAILIRDSNELVSIAVVSSPKLTESEVESFARMANVSEEILRIIGQERAWMKNYAIVAALARNPKTPLALSMNLLPRLIERDLRAVSIDRNVPDVLRTTARRRLAVER